MVLLLQSQRQYVFEFDASARVTAVTMPSVARHTMFTHVSVGYIRNTYNPPESNASIIHDFSEDGRPQAVHYLGTGRRVLYKYGKLAKLSEIVYDSTAVTFGYDETAGVLKMVNLQSGGFSCTIRYRKMGPLIDKQIYRFSEEGMVNARFDYTYHDNSFRIASMKPVISETPLPVDLYRYDEISGKVIFFSLVDLFVPVTILPFNTNDVTMHNFHETRKRSSKNEKFLSAYFHNMTQQTGNSLAKKYK